MSTKLVSCQLSSMTVSCGQPIPDKSNDFKKPHKHLGLLIFYNIDSGCVSVRIMDSTSTAYRAAYGAVKVAALGKQVKGMRAASAASKVLSVDREYNTDWK